MKLPQEPPLRLNALQDAQARAILLETEILVLSCVFWKMDTPRVIQRRRLSDSLFYIPIRGRMRCRVDDTEGVIGPGAFLMVAEDVEHEAWMDTDCDFIEAYAIHAHVYTHHAKPLLAHFNEPFGRMEPIDFWQSQLALLTWFFAKGEEAAKKFGTPLLRSLLLQQLLHGKHLEAQPQAGDERIWNAVYHILNNHASPLAVSDLAQRAGLSQVQFRKLFRRHTGSSPKAYIQKLRLSKAKALMQTDPQMTVKEVAARTGIGDVHYFHEIFRRTYGSSPGEYRFREEH